MNKERSLDGSNLSIGDLADVEGLYRLEGPILPPNLMMMLNLILADKIIDKNRIQPKSRISNLLKTSAKQ